MAAGCLAYPKKYMRDWKYWGGVISLAMSRSLDNAASLSKDSVGRRATKALRKPLCARIAPRHRSTSRAIGIEGILSVRGSSSQMSYGQVVIIDCCSLVWVPDQFDIIIIYCRFSNLIYVTNTCGMQNKIMQALLT